MWKCGQSENRMIGSILIEGWGRIHAWSWLVGCSDHPTKRLPVESLSAKVKSVYKMLISLPCWCWYPCHTDADILAMLMLTLLVALVQLSIKMDTLPQISQRRSMALWIQLECSAKGRSNHNSQRLNWRFSPFPADNHILVTIQDQQIITTYL